MKLFWRYQSHLEAELVRQELLLKFVINDKDRLIEWQAEEIKRLRGKVDRMEIALTPAPRLPVEKREFKATAAEGETTWTAYLNRYMQEEEAKAQKAKEHQNGVHEQGGAGIHQSPGTDAQRPDGGSATTATGEGKVSS